MSHRDAILVIDQHAMVSEWSRTAERLLGRSAEEAVGRPAAALLIGCTDAGRQLAGRLRIGALPGGEGGLRWGVWIAPPAAPLSGGLGSALLEPLFTQSPIGLHVFDLDLRVVRANTAASGMRGVREDEILGRSLAEAYERYESDAVERGVRDVLATGRPRIDRQVRGRPASDPDREHVFSTSSFRLEGTDGQPLGVVVAAIDVTEHEHAQGRLDLLHTARRRVGQSLDVLRTAQELVDVTVPGLADVTVVALSDAVLRGEDTLPGDGPPLLRCAATGQVDSDQRPPEVGTILLPGLFGQSLRASASLLPAAPGGPAGGPAAKPSLVAPLTVRGAVLGAVAFHRPLRSDPFEDADLVLASDLAAHTALGLDNALRFTREHAMLLALQGHRARSSPSTRIALESAHRPARQGGGAWSDVIPLSGARVALVVGRPLHPGVRAVAAMGQLRTAVHTLAQLNLDPHDVLARLHRTAIRLGQEQEPVFGTAEPGASCTYAVYDPVSGRCSVAQAGSQLLLVARPDGTVDPAAVAEGPLLGSGGPPFPTAEFDLGEGSTVCMASCRPGVDCPPLDRVVAALAEPGLPVALVADRLDPLLAPDTVLLAARTRTLGEDRVASWNVAPELSAVSRARKDVNGQLERWGYPTDPFAVELIISELVTNAIRHGSPPVTLRLINDETLTCEVTDGADTAPHLRHAKAGDEGGRGLLICADLAENWGVRYTDEGKTIWAELPPDPPP